MILKIGKVPNSILKKIIIDKIPKLRNEIILRPDIGEDCAAFNLNGDCCVITTDPITGSVNDIGELSINVICNDIASSGAEPVGVLVTILLPVGTKEEDLIDIFSNLNSAAVKNNIEIVGGHTEVTPIVNKILISATGFGRVKKENIISTKGAKENDSLIMTKSAGLEGIAIITSEKENELIDVFGNEMIKNTQKYINDISVIKEGSIAAQNGASAMHDVTEGGILGAAWEIASSSNIGLEIIEKSIYVTNETIQICQYYNINPLRLISSGSMLIACKNGENMIEQLKKNNITASIIGEFKGTNIRLVKNNGDVEIIIEPDSDEIYKVI